LFSARRKPRISVSLGGASTKVCQIYDMSWGFKPIPPDYKVLTKSLPSFDAALKSKAGLAKKGQCSV